MRIVTPEQSRLLDAETFRRPDCHSKDFIEIAGSRAAERIRQYDPTCRKALVLCGPGHNGADGHVIARVLQKEGWTIEERIFEKTGPGPISDVLPEDCELVVDALFGTGLNRPLAESWRKLFLAIERGRRQKKWRVISIDTPSGLNAKTGRAEGPAVRADLTLAMQFLKIGFLQNEGRDHCGQLEIIPLPYPRDLLRHLPHIVALGPRWASRHLPQRSLSGNKGTFGRLNLVAGSRKYPGAALLAARAALRVGVGYVNVIQFDVGPAAWRDLPEVLHEEWHALPKDSTRPGTWCLGPGVTDKTLLEKLIHRLLEQGISQVVLDATALEVVKKLKSPLPTDWILTPHPKELANMLGVTTDQIQNDRLAALGEATSRMGGTFVLKGYKTLIGNSRQTAVCLRGHSVLAKAGSGDVLSGIIAGLRGQIASAPVAAGLGVTLHALTGDLWCETRDVASLTPTEMIDILPFVLKRLRHDFSGSADRLDKPVMEMRR